MISKLVGSNMKKSQVEKSKRSCTYRYIQFDVSRFGEPVNHSGAKVIQPEAVNHVSVHNHDPCPNRANTSDKTHTPPHRRR